MKKGIIISLFLVSAVSASVSAAMSVLSIKDSLHTVPNIYPESFEADTKAMQENWYLKNYAVIDNKADSKATVEVTDEVLIARLQALPTVIEMPFNSVVKRYIEMYVGQRKQLVENMLGLSLYYMPIFEEALDRHGLPLELKYLPIIESALNPVAVSRAGATGLWQFMLPAATGEGLEVNSIVDQRRDPYASSEAAATYLKKLYDIFGDWTLAIAAYNCGPGNVNKALRRVGTDKKDYWEIYPFLPAETRGYVPAFIAANYVMNYYGEHNISPALARKPIVVDTVHVTKRVYFQQISDVMDIPMDELRVLNPQYRKDFIPGDIKPYSLVLPSLQAYAYVANEDSIVNHDAALYARRDVVEPNSGNVSGSDSKGEYVEELIVKWHTVKRGETLSSIAKKYGVTQASIRKANKIGKKVKRGQKLKINTYRRRYIDTPSKASVPDSTVVVVDSVSVVNSAAVPDSVVVCPDSLAAPGVLAGDVTSAESRQVAEAMKQAEDKAKVKAESNKSKKGSSKAKTVTHKVRRGDNLYKISKQYGVTIDAIKKANNLKGDNISVGQKLKIPKK